MTGVNIYSPSTQQFEFRQGPIFAQVVLADEINRATPKTQSALLEAMEERQVTVDGTTYPLGITNTSATNTASAKNSTAGPWTVSDVENMVKALPKLGDGPFFHVNSDTIWIDGVKPNLARLADAFDPERMDALLLLATTASSIGYSGHGDFSMAADGRLTRRGEREVVPFVYAGAAILTPAFFTGAPAGAFSMSPLFDRAAEAGRLCGLRLEGVWMHVGTPDAIAAAERALLASAV